MEIVTIANVSGFIAVAIVVFQFLLPTLLVLMLSNFVGDNHNAITWSVIGRFVQSSNWPTLLQTDTVATSGVKNSVSIIAWTQTIGLLLVAITGIVTPLGLYDGFKIDDPEEHTFNYGRDSGPFGYATPPRPELGFTRRCGSVHPVPCPGATFPYQANETLVNGTLAQISIDMPEGYDGRIPSSLYNYFDSGANRGSKTISGLWDIEWRKYNYAQDTNTDVTVYNGSKYVVGGFQIFDNTIVNPGVRAIEGLIVDSENGGVGFRNHSLPSIQEGQSEWSEDLLFIEPEVVCVPNNLSIDFTLADQLSNSQLYTHVRLVDHGGFVNLDLDHGLGYNGTDSQNNPDLYTRAYMAAWANNLLMMWYFNITDFGNGKVKISEPSNYTYLDSEVRKEIPLVLGSEYSEYMIDIDRLRSTQLFGDFMQLPTEEDITVFELEHDATVQGPNPYNVTQDDFHGILDVCQHWWHANGGNISTVAFSCSMVYTPSEFKGEDRANSYLVIEPGKEASIHMYSCASAAKASIKTVDLRLNGTTLDDLAVTNVSPKDYSNEEVPMWAVESTNMKLSDGVPLWGLVDPNIPPIPNVTTIQREFLYLPGYVDNSTLNGFTSSQNMPGLDFYNAALESMTRIGYDSSFDIDFSISNRLSLIGRPADYSGVNNAPLFRRWLQTSTTAEGIATILKLVFTDISANSVVGTKGIHGKRSSQSHLSRRADSPASLSASDPRVTVSRHTVSYRWRYAVPAFMTILLMIVVGLITLFSCIKNRTLIKSVREVLYKTSTGRIMAGLLYPQNGNPAAKTSEWAKRSGTHQVDFAGRVPKKDVAAAVSSSVSLITPETKDSSYQPIPEKYGFDFSSRRMSRYDVY